MSVTTEPPAACASAFRWYPLALLPCHDGRTGTALREPIADSNRRLIARSDTYYCLKNGADGLLRRVARTITLAPRKHFVTELPTLVADGRLTRRELWKTRLQWLRGVAEGIVITPADVARLSLPRRVWNRFAYGLYRAVLQVLTLGSYTR